MAVRIRYTKNGNFLTSKAFVSSGGVKVISLINLDTGTFEIANVDSDQVLITATGIKNTTVLKQRARKALLELGVALVTEVRNVGGTVETVTSTSADVSVERAI